MANFEENWRFILRLILNRLCLSKIPKLIYPSYLFRPWKPWGESRSNGPRSKGQKSSHPMPWTAFGKSWTIKTFTMNQTSLISRQNLWILRMIWHHRKGTDYFEFNRRIIIELIHIDNSLSYIFTHFLRQLDILNA